MPSVVSVANPRVLSVSSVVSVALRVCGACAVCGFYLALVLLAVIIARPFPVRTLDIHRQRVGVRRDLLMVILD